MPSDCRRADVLSFALRYMGQEPENDVRDLRPGQVPAMAGVQQGHIQRPDARLYFLGDMPSRSILLIIKRSPGFIF